MILGEGKSIQNSVQINRLSTLLLLVSLSVGRITFFHFTFISFGIFCDRS